MVTKALTFDDFFAYVASGVVVVDFYAKWCEPCQRFMKVLPRLEAKLAGKATVGTVDVDAQPLLTQTYDVIKVPTFVVFKDGQEVHRWEGMVPTITEIATEALSHS